MIICSCMFRAPTYPVFRDNPHFQDCPLFKKPVLKVQLNEVEEMAFASGYYDNTIGRINTRNEKESAK